MQGVSSFVSSCSFPCEVAGKQMFVDMVTADKVCALRLRITFLFGNRRVGRDGREFAIFNMMGVV